MAILFTRLELTDTEGKHLFKRNITAAGNCFRCDSFTKQIPRIRDGGLLRAFFNSLSPSPLVAQLHAELVVKLLVEFRKQAVRNVHFLLLEEAATVADGVVKAVGAGTATITATAADGSNVAGSYVVTVQAVSTVAYHKYTATGKGGATATMSDDTVLKGSDITVTDNKAESAIVVGSVKSGVKGTNTTLDFGAEYTTAKTSWVNGDAIQTYEFTITAVNACTIEKIESSMVTGSSGSVSWAIYLDDTTTASATVTGKDGVLSVADLNKSLSANDTLKVKIVATATGDIGSASSTKAFKITCGPIVVTAK